MSALFEVLGGVLGEAFGPSGNDHSRGDGDVFLDQDPPHPNFVVLHFHRPQDVVLLAVHRRELTRVGAVLQLPL